MMIEPRYQSDKVTLYCADCLDVLPQLEPGSVDAVVTDPPYGTNSYSTDHEIDPMVYRSWVNDYKTIALFGYPELVVKWCVQAQLVPDEWITWNPINKFTAQYNNLPKEI